MKSETIKGVTAIVVAATIYAFTGVFIRFLTGLGLNVYSVNFVELLIGVPLVFLVSRIVGEKIQRPTFKECLWLALIGLCYFGATMTLFYAYNYTTIANVEFLHYTFPILTTFGAALLLKERLNIWKATALVLSGVGLILIFNPTLALTREMQLGNLLAFASAFPVAVTTLVGRRLKHRSAYFTTLWSMLGAAIVYLPFFISHNSISGFGHLATFQSTLGAIIISLPFFIAHNSIWSFGSFLYHFVFNEAVMLGLRQVGYIALVSLLFMASAAPLYYYGLRHLEASKAGVLLLMEVVVAVIVAAILYKEILTPLSAIGGLLILASGLVILKSEPARRTVMVAQIRRTSHAFYQIRYHFVWVPKRRRDVLVDSIAQKTRDVLTEIAEQHDLEIDLMDVQESYVHVELSAPPKYAPAEIARWLKDISSREVFAAFPQLKEKLWAGEFWADGYYVSTSGDGIIPDVIEQYTQYQSQYPLLEPLAQRE
jgi:putative transposase